MSDVWKRGLAWLVSILTDLTLLLSSSSSYSSYSYSCSSSSSSSSYYYYYYSYYYYYYYFYFAFCEHSDRFNNQCNSGQVPHHSAKMPGMLKKPQVP